MYSPNKIALIGTEGVGKTSILERYKENSGNYQIEVAETPDKWAESKYGIVVFDTTNTQDLEQLHKSIKQFKKVAGDVPIVICANKVDMFTHDARNNSKEYMKMYTKFLSLTLKYNCQGVMVSAKINYNIDKPFALAELYLR